MADKLVIQAICVDDKEFTPIGDAVVLEMAVTDQAYKMKQCLRKEIPGLDGVHQGLINILRIRSPVRLNAKNEESQTPNQPTTNAEGEQLTRRTRSLGLDLDRILEQLRRESQGQNTPSLSNNYVEKLLPMAS